ncbi:AMP-binding protein, partial [Jeotgalicoccus sp. S0W5]|uniref:AMP-binding protein n=1 Tax=Jeotgalicoccus sp. S0W5 TaxID=2527874 RepID=UPI001414EC17
SGTTGTPKGVQIIHSNISRLVKGTDYVDFNAPHIYLQLSPISFDASTFEIWGSLLNGNKMIIIESNRPTLDEISQKLETENVTILFLTTALFNLMVDHHPSSLQNLRQLLMGGEAVSVHHVKKALSLKKFTLTHVYGPTENTTFSTYFNVPGEWKEQSTVPIGKPINNTKAYILNTD